jgi:hypothetical protein
MNPEPTQPICDSYRIVPHDELQRWTKEQWLNIPENWHIRSRFPGFGGRVITTSISGQCPEAFKLIPWSYYGYSEPEGCRRVELASASKRVKTGCETTSSAHLPSMEDEEHTPQTFEAQFEVDPLPPCYKNGGFCRVITVGKPDELFKCPRHGCFIKDCP